MTLFSHLRIGEGLEKIDEKKQITLPAEIVLPYEERNTSLDK